MEGIMQQRELGTNKIVYIDREDPERLARIREQIMMIPGVEVTSSWNNNIEIMPRDVHKGTALAMLSHMLHMEQSHVMAIGDNDNDIPMLKWAGYGVAMSNASQGARAAAEFETDGNESAGVAKAIRRFALGKAEDRSS
jgi:Cof subfamily protein (haloacid dehalogenase superfamily)